MGLSLPILRRLSLVLVFAAPAAAQDWIDAPRVVLPDGPDEIRKVADLDGDGDADLLVVADDPSGSVLSFHALLKEQGEFVAGATTVVPVEPNVSTGQLVFALGDLTGDGLPDVVMDVRDINSTGVNGLRLYPNTGGGFAGPIFVPTDAVVQRAALADADADGTLELALMLVVYPSASYAIGWWRWNGTTLVPRPHTSVEQYSQGLFAADLNGDGRSELLVTNNHQLALYSTLPGGQPEQVSTFFLDVGGFNGSFLHAGDLDGDGDVDVLATSRRALTSEDLLRMQVLDNEDGVLVPRQAQGFHVGTETLGLGDGFLADWDLDGDSDFLTQNEGLILVENRGDSFELADLMRTMAYDPFHVADTPRGGGVGDLNGDGLPDFAVGHYVYAGDGRLGEAGLVPDYFVSELGPQDFDGDGDLDVPDFIQGASSYLFENDGAGHLTARALSTPAAPAGHFFEGEAPPADLDGDGVGDLLRVLRRDEYPTNPVIETRFFQGSPLGTFTNARAAGAPGMPIEPPVFDNLTADLDSDGDMDVLGWGGYWENDGTGFFPAFHPSWSESAVRTADVDGDGDLDELTRTRTGALSLARNQNGAFTSEPIASQVNVAPVLGDLDGDGDLDLGVSTNAGGPAVLLYENSGGSFVAPHRLDVSEADPRVALDDFDGDGRIDVLAMPISYERIEWRLWLQSSTPWEFAAPVKYLGDNMMLSADFDSDGDLDFFGTRIVRSRRFDGPSGGGIRQSGAGWAGGEPIAPLLGARGPLRPGSPNAVLRVSRARGGAVGTLLLSNRAILTGPAGKARFFGSPNAPALAFALGGTPGASGAGTFEMPLGPATLALQGRTIWMQALIHDPALSRRFDSTTNALELTFGN